MKVTSDIRPEKIWHQEIENNMVKVLLRDNIVEKQINNDWGEQETIYEYDEVKIEIVNRQNLIKYIEDHFDELFMLGERIEFEKTLPDNFDYLLTIITGLMIEVDFLTNRINQLEMSLND